MLIILIQNDTKLHNIQLGGKDGRVVKSLGSRVVKSFSSKQEVPGSNPGAASVGQ